VSAQDIRERVSMFDALELVGLDQPAKQHVNCPFHEDDTASLAVWADHGHCYGCGWHGDVIKFVADLMVGGRAGKAIAWLDGAVDLDAPKIERKQRELLDLGGDLERAAANAWSTSYKEAEAWVAEKWPHLGLEQLEQWGVYVGRYNLLIPHLDHDGVVRGVKTRAFTGGEKGKKGAFEGSCFTTRLYRAVEAAGTRNAILTEGESDCWTMTLWARGAVDVLALPSGCNTWNAEFERELLQYRRVHLLLDMDPAGRSAGARIQRALMDAGARQVDHHFWSQDYNDVTEAYIDGWRPEVLGL
jgi:DNA primase